jgi:hypothetical protein
VKSIAALHCCSLFSSCEVTKILNTHKTLESTTQGTRESNDALVKGRFSSLCSSLWDLVAEVNWSKRI